MLKSEFVDKLLPLAEQLEKDTKIYKLVPLTQAALESGWGESELTVKANNLFGFTGDAWKAEGKPVIELPTFEFIEGHWQKPIRPFRSYPSWLESLQDWAHLISSYPRYKQAYDAATTGHPHEFFHFIQTGGYATDPSYTTKLEQTYSVILALLRGKL